MFNGFVIALHGLGAVIWVGGMFFAHQCLRPAALQLSPDLRCSLWQATLQRFFHWIWSIVVVLPLTGYIMLFGRLGGFTNAGWNVHAMQLLGLSMIGIFLWVYFIPYQQLLRQTQDRSSESALQSLARIRRLVGWNLSLGLATTALAIGGKHW